MTTNPAELVALVLATLLFGVTTTYVFADHLRDMWSGHRSATSWKKTSGTVIQAEWKKSRGGRRARSRWYADIVYKYNLQGREFECSQVELPRGEQPRSLLGRYPQGSQVTVYYEPDNPANAVLQTGLSREAWASSLFGFAVMGVCMGYLIQLTRVNVRCYRLRGRSPDPKKT